MQNKKSGYKFPISIQLVLPDNYRDSKDFNEVCSPLLDLGFFGVELNIADFENVPIGMLQDFLAGYNLRLSMFASGKTAQTFGLSLSHEDASIRSKSVAACKRMIDYVEGTDAGIIVGFLKGKNDIVPATACELLKLSLSEIAPYTTDKKVNLLIEATNRYESPVARSLEDSVDLVKDLGSPYMRILPDTFHMNIEESDMLEALDRYFEYFDSVHVSDNNRFFPGFGAINFDAVLSFLEKKNFLGGIAIEGNTKKNLIDDIRYSVEYLVPYLYNSR